MLSEDNVIFLEVKNETGMQSPAQVAFQQTCHRTGFEYHVVRSVEDVFSLLKDASFPLLKAKQHERGKCESAI